MIQDQSNAIWELEERFWLGSPDFYASALAPEALMVLPQPAGILGRDETIDSISSGSRWRAVSFKERHCVFPAPETAVVAYVAHADRGPDTSYSARCSSTYVRDNGRWLLVLHHQTPVGQPSGGNA